MCVQQRFLYTRFWSLWFSLSGPTEEVYLCSFFFFLSCFLLFFFWFESVKCYFKAAGCSLPPQRTQPLKPRRTSSLCFSAAPCKERDPLTSHTAQSRLSHFCLGRIKEQFIHKWANGVIISEQRTVRSSLQVICWCGTKQFCLTVPRFKPDWRWF